MVQNTQKIRTKKFSVVDFWTTLLRATFLDNSFSLVQFCLPLMAHNLGSQAFTISLNQTQTKTTLLRCITSPLNLAVGRKRLKTAGLFV